MWRLEELFAEKTWHKCCFKMLVSVKIAYRFIMNKTLVYKCKKEGNNVGRRKQNIAAIKIAVKKGNVKVNFQMGR
jgi:hypothetical protein